MNKIFLIIVMVVALGSPALAGSWARGMGRGMGYGLGHCTDSELNLTPDQASKLKALQSEYLKSIRPFQMELLDKRAELRICEPGMGREAVRAAQLRRRVQEIDEKIREAWLRYKMECRALLTLDQLDRLDALKGTGGSPGMGRMRLMGE